uniref:Uncharacterized protein n=1 Tax=Romanomermis culicivorax TaxID=13658 RepID=A0A915K735_ROMCU
MPAGERQNREICVKEGNVANYYPHPIFFYNWLCQVSEDDCGYPENEADIQKARDFNYFGQCQCKSSSGSFEFFSD